MISEKMLEEFEKQKKENPGFIVLIRRGIFHYLLQEQAERLAASLNLKLKTITENSPSGETKTVKSCGFPDSGLDKYVGRMVRRGENIIIFEDGKITEKIEVHKGIKQNQPAG